MSLYIRSLIYNITSNTKASHSVETSNAVSNTEADLKESVAYMKTFVYNVSLENALSPFLSQVDHTGSSN